MTRGRSRRKLAFFGALYPYLGGKRRLCPVIFREIDRVVPRSTWSGLTFVDAFSGGGAVSLFAKALGLRVTSVDIATRAQAIGDGLIANSRTRLSRDDILRLLAPRSGAPGRIESQHAPAAFTVEQARFLDSALESAEGGQDPAKAALCRLLAIRVAMLAHPLSQVRPGTIERVTSGGWESVSPKCVKNYVDGPRLLRPDRLWTLAQRINAGVFEGEGWFIKGDALELLPTIQADIAYFDPPYPGTRSYEAEYKTIDAILGDTARPVSAFSRNDGTGMLDEVLKRASHIPVWVLSFGNVVADLGDLEGKMKALGRETGAVAVKYAHRESVASEEKRAINREFVVVGWDPDSALLRRVCSGGQIDRRLELVVPGQPDLHLGGPEAATPLPLVGDRLQEGHEPLSAIRSPGSRGTLRPHETGIDDPEAVLGECSADRDDVREDGHDPTVAGIEH